MFFTLRKMFWNVFIFPLLERFFFWDDINQIKSNHFYCHITIAQVPWWVKFLWACSRQCRKTTDNLPMDRQCKKNNRQFTYGQTVQKTALEHLQCSRQCKKNKNPTTAIYIWTDSAKKQQQFTYGQYSIQYTTANLNSSIAVINAKYKLHHHPIPIY